jgi:hypothetical protein
VKITTKEPSTTDYQRFVRDGLGTWTDENPSNVVHDFQKMTKLFGLPYILWLEIQYRILQDGYGNMDELCRWNGNVPSSFFKKFDK